MVLSVARSQGYSSGLVTEVDNNWMLNPLPLPTNPLFGTDGIRGKVGELLNEPLALQVGFWAGVVLQNHVTESGPIILGQDSRNSSDMLAMALSAGLTAAGLEVWYLGL
ncbi:phosphoglucosamine mutase, partial [Cuspidothrix issatschenkoi LEGE 03284]|nr:phosphoglucosamine mutase [Cuspidothrix issatschenkoi LEGE 03284]